MRRNNLSLLIGFVLLISVSQAAVLGIDFGSQFFKISLNAPKKQFLIVENTTSNRKTMNAISFYNNERVYDKDASNKQSRNPENTFVFLDKFLGALESDKTTFEISRKYYEEYAMSFDKERETVMFELKRFTLDDPDEVIVLSVEEVVGMILSSAKRYSEKMADIPNIRDCVITVPITWSLRSRVALVQAAKIAGLAPLALIYDNSAAALHYGLSRLTSNTTSTMIFYNMGATNIQASLVEYSFLNNTVLSDTQQIIPVITVLADAGIRDVGGYAYDLVIANFFADAIDALPNRKNKPSFRTNRKGMVKLLKESNKAKEILSANKALPFFSEGLLEGNDFNGHISRQQFEDAAADLLSQVTKPLDEILLKANKTIEQIDSIELIGGGIRVPKIQQILSEYMNKKELGFHLNGDESMALGAAFQAANYSSAFRVKKVHLNDGYNFDVRLNIKDLNPVEEKDEEGHTIDPFEKSHNLFPAKSRFNTKKTISVKHDRDLSIEVFAQYSEKDIIKLAHFNITNITSIKDTQLYKEAGKPKISLTFELGSINTIDLVDAMASLKITQMVEVEDTKSKESNNEKQEAPQEEEKHEDKKEEEQPEHEKEEAKQEDKQEGAKEDGEKEKEKHESDQEKEKHESEQEKEKQEGDNEQQDEQEKLIDNEETPKDNEEIQINKDNQEKTDAEPKSDKKFREKSRIIEFELDIYKNYPFYKPLNQTQVEASMAKLKRFDKYENQIRRTVTEKNNLESLAYSVREFVEQETFKKFSNEAERALALELADKSVEWLGGDESTGAGYEDFKMKLNELKLSIKPTIYRIDEYQLRPQALNSTLMKLADYSSKMMKLNKTMSWITDEQKLPMFEILTSIKDWITTKTDEQEKLELFVDPVLTTKELESKVNEVKREFEKLKKIKKPKEEKKEEEKKGEGDSKDEKKGDTKEEQKKNKNSNNNTNKEESKKDKHNDKQQKSNQQGEEQNKHKDNHSNEDKKKEEEKSDL